MVDIKWSEYTPTLKNFLVENGIKISSIAKLMKRFWSMSDMEFIDLLYSTDSMGENDRWKVGFVLRLEMNGLS